MARGAAGSESVMAGLVSIHVFMTSNWTRRAAQAFLFWPSKNRDAIRGVIEPALRGRPGQARPRRWRYREVRFDPEDGRPDPAAEAPGTVGSVRGRPNAVSIDFGGVNTGEL